MREIKFRAWDSKNDIMVYQDEEGIFDFKKNGDRVRSVQDLWSITTHFYKDIIPMQFTGLLDKNRKEIYEGDILQRIGRMDIFQGTADDIPGANPITITEEVVELKVCSNEFGSATFGYSINTQRTYSERTKPATYEIIGNKFENPELLNP